MKINPKHNGLIIGAMFTVGSLILAFTLMPLFLMLSVGEIIEEISTHISNYLPLKTPSIALLISLSIVIFALVFVLMRCRKHKISSQAIVAFMMLTFPFLHILGFYIDWGHLNFRSDGQLIFLAVESYPISSLGFIAIGILIDRVKPRTISDIKNIKP